jgi:hypothetical protein
METTQENTQEAVVSDMVEQIRLGEQEEQELEREGVEQDDDESMPRPAIGKDVKLEEPAPRKEYVPIRNRKQYKELLRASAKAMSFLEHVTNRRAIYDVNDEAAALSEVSKVTYVAMRYIAERLEERRKEKGGATTGNHQREIVHPPWPENMANRSNNHNKDRTRKKA